MRSKSYAPDNFSYFDWRNTAVKESILADYAGAEQRYIPQHFEIKKLLEGSNMTIVTWHDTEFGVAIFEVCFAQNALERKGVCE
jgi:hypothetical protein